MNELTNEELDQILENAMEVMFILSEECLIDEVLFPKEQDLLLLESNPEYTSKVEELIFKLLFGDEFEFVKTFLQQALKVQPTNPVFLLYQALAYYVTGGKQIAFNLAQTIDGFALNSRQEKNEIVTAFLPNEDFPIDFPAIIDFSSLSQDQELLLKVQKLCFEIQLYSSLQNHTQAITRFHQLLPLVNNPPELVIELADTYQYAKQYHEAKKLLREALKRKPKSPKALYLLAFTHRSLGEYEQAIGFFWKYLKQEPDDYVVLVPLIICYEELHLTEKAVDLLEQALVFCPQLEDSDWRLIPTMDKLIRIVQEKRRALANF